eukprot:TRINITY_DN10680_c0_g1_i3.p1 TRINITY_DN10680_c0_g1~~TRINITY_DN10680_c0_g1_i3.p1  ORF type:complete len:458 (-),score=111.90 TRINITY_DN10680_c0_g1_i3:124-1497(-)
MAICTYYRFINVFKPLLMLALDEYFRSPGEDCLKQLYETINSMNLALPQWSPIDKRVMRASRLSLSALRGQVEAATMGHDNNTDVESVTVVQWKNARVSLRVPLILEPDEIDAVSVIGVVKKFSEHIMAIYNAILTEKRVLFVGHNQPAHDVCSLVLGACLLVCPPLQGTLQRAFPYATLTNMDFLQVPGYIAGVTNPIFEHHPEWWDVLCNLNTGEVTLAPAYATQLAASMQPPVSPADPAQLLKIMQQNDADFVAEVMSGIDMHYSEEWVRCMFRDYTQHLIWMCCAEEEFVDDAAMVAQMESNASRLSACSRTRAFAAFSVEHQNQVRNSPFGPAAHALLRKQARTLQVRRVTDEEISVTIRNFLDHIHTAPQIREFLTFFPDSQRGLMPIAMSILHADLSIRLATCRLLHLIQQHPDGERFVNNLNYFLLLSYQRSCRELLGIEDNEEEEKSV